MGDQSSHRANISGKSRASIRSFSGVQCFVKDLQLQVMIFKLKLLTCSFAWSMLMYDSLGERGGIGV